MVISPLFVGAVASDVDIEGSGLLDGLDGQAREERAELVAWLLGQDFRQSLALAGLVIGIPGITEQEARGLLGGHRRNASIEIPPLASWGLRNDRSWPYRDCLDLRKAPPFKHAIC